MSKAKSGPGKGIANILVRDRNGEPKISWANVWLFYDRLGPEDQAAVRRKHPDHPKFQEEEDE